MKALFNYLLARINSQVPAIKTVRYWNNQPKRSNGQNKETRIEKPFIYPACFIEFIFETADNRCLKIVDYVLIVRFRFAREDYKYERLDQFDFADSFAAAMQGLAATSGSGLTFTTFQEVPRGTFEEEFNNVEEFYIDYRTRFRYLGAYVPKSTIPGPLAFPDPTITIAETL